MDNRRIEYDVDLFKREYKKGATLKQMAKSFNVSPAMISKWARENDMPYKWDRKTNEEVKAIYDCYKESGIKVAIDRFNLSRHKIYHWRRVYEKSLLKRSNKIVNITKNKKGFGW